MKKRYQTILGRENILNKIPNYIPYRQVKRGRPPLVFPLEYIYFRFVRVLDKYKHDVRTYDCLVRTVDAYADPSRKPVWRERCHRFYVLEKVLLPSLSPLITWFAKTKTKAGIHPHTEKDAIYHFEKKGVQLYALPQVMYKPTHLNLNVMIALKQYVIDKRFDSLDIFIEEEIEAIEETDSSDLEEWSSDSDFSENDEYSDYSEYSEYSDYEETKEMEDFCNAHAEILVNLVDEECDEKKPLCKRDKIIAIAKDLRGSGALDRIHMDKPYYELCAFFDPEVVVRWSGPRRRAILEQLMNNPFELCLHRLGFAPLIITDVAVEACYRYELTGKLPSYHDPKALLKSAACLYNRLFQRLMKGIPYSDLSKNILGLEYLLTKGYAYEVYVNKSFPDVRRIALKEYNECQRIFQFC